jgi:hypothetical protein
MRHAPHNSNPDDVYILFAVFRSIPIFRGFLMYARVYGHCVVNSLQTNTVFSCTTRNDRYYVAEMQT